MLKGAGAGAAVDCDAIAVAETWHGVVACCSPTKKLKIETRSSDVQLYGFGLAAMM